MVFLPNITTNHAITYTNILQNVFLLAAVRKFQNMPDFLNSLLGQIIVSNLTNVRKVTQKQCSTLRTWNQKKKRQMQYNYSSSPVEMQLAWKPWSNVRIAEDFSTRKHPVGRSTKSSLFLQTMISDEANFLTSGAFLNQKTNKQASQEQQTNLDSSCIWFCRSSEKWYG